MRKLMLLFLFITSFTGFAKDNPYNSATWWKRLVYEKAPSVNNFSNIDTSIIVVTNRRKADDRLRFMSEHRGDGQLVYFFVYSSNGRWHVLETGSLEKALSYTPQRGRDWVVYTEGMGKIFPSELNRGMMMAAQYKVNVIMLDYPSITTTKSMFGNYLFSLRNARHSYEDFAPVLERIKKLKTTGQLGTGKLSLFFHSMGNYLAQKIVTENKLEPLNNTVWVNNLILNAPCVPEKGHADWLRWIHFTENIYIQYNPEDHVLKGAGLVSFTRQLGVSPRYPVATKAQYVNFHELVGRGHSYFLELSDHLPMHPVSKQYYHMVLHGDTVNFALLNKASEQHYGANVRRFR